MNDEYNGPWRFDGHGINDKIGTRIAKVSLNPYPEGNERNPLFDKYSNLIKEAPTMLDTLERIAPVLERATHLIKIFGNEYETRLFENVAELVRETILDTRR